MFFFVSALSGGGTTVRSSWGSRLLESFVASYHNKYLSWAFLGALDGQFSKIGSLLGSLL